MVDCMVDDVDGVDVGMRDRQDKKNGINCGLTGRVYDIMI